jgi:glycosyltransferase involved in cell wall biosynthesis
MRITFMLPHAGLSGGVRVVAIYAQRLQQRGHRVTILSTPFRLHGIAEHLRNLWFRLGLWMSGKPEPSHLNGIGVEHRLLKSPNWLDPADVPDADVIVATWWETAEHVAKLPCRHGAHAYFIQGYEAHGWQPAERVDATWRLPMQKIVVARWLAELARSRFADDTAILASNAVDLQQFAVPVRARQSRPTVGMLYSGQEFKGSDVCIRAIEIARRSVPDLQVVGFGTSQLHETEMPPDTCYFSLPAQDQLKDIYGRCDVWLFGSRREGFGLPILEAMACRTPVIATPAGAAPELLADGGGVLVRMDDPRDMAAAIVRIARMPEPQWRELSEAALATAQRNTWDAATTRFEEALRATIRRSNPHGEADRVVPAVPASNTTRLSPLDQSRSLPAPAKG